MYVELDLDFLAIVVPKVGALITEEANEFLESCHKTKLPGVVGWNFIKLAYEVFVKNYGVLYLENFDCPTGVSPLLFPSFVFIIITKQLDFNLTVSS